MIREYNKLENKCVNHDPANEINLPTDSDHDEINTSIIKSVRRFRSCKPTIQQLNDRVSQSINDLKELTDRAQLDDEIEIDINIVMNESRCTAMRW